VTTHEIPLEPRTVHGWFSRDYEPVLSVEPGDRVELQSLNAGWRWNIEERWDVAEGAGHALTGPILVRGAQAGGTLAVHFDELRVASWGATKLAYLITRGAPKAGTAPLTSWLRTSTTLAMSPKLMLLDEPTQGMGTEDVDRIRQLIKKVSADRTILMVEHNMSVVSSIADTITVLQRGATLAEGPYAEVSKNPAVIEAYMGSASTELKGAH